MWVIINPLVYFCRCLTIARKNDSSHPLWFLTTALEGPWPNGHSGYTTCTTCKGANSEQGLLAALPASLGSSFVTATWAWPMDFTTSLQLTAEVG